MAAVSISETMYYSGDPIHGDSNNLYLYQFIIGTYTRFSYLSYLFPRKLIYSIRGKQKSRKNIDLVPI